VGGPASRSGRLNPGTYWTEGSKDVLNKKVKPLSRRELKRGRTKISRPYLAVPNASASPCVCLIPQGILRHPIKDIAQFNTEYLTFHRVAVDTGSR